MKKPERVAEGVYIVGGPQITDGRDCCVTLLTAAPSWPCGCGSRYSSRSILENIENLVWTILLKYIIVTHGHIDHIGFVLFPGAGSAGGVSPAGLQGGF